MSAFIATQLVSVGGVLILIALAWLMGFRDRARIDSEDAVRAMVAAERLPAPAAVAIDIDGRTALAEIDADTVFLVKTVGDRFTTRRFSRKAVAGVKMYRPKGKGIGARLRFSDAGLDDIRIEFSSREAPAFIERLRRGAQIR